MGYLSEIVSDIEDASSIIYIRDMDGRYVYVNDNYESMLPFTREQVLGKTNRELFGEEAARQWEATDMLTSASGSYTTTEEIMYDQRTRKWRKFVSTKATIVDETGKAFLAGISVEVKDKKALEYERRLADLRARFLVRLAGER